MLIFEGLVVGTGDRVPRKHQSVRRCGLQKQMNSDSQNLQHLLLIFCRILCVICKRNLSKFRL